MTLLTILDTRQLETVTGGGAFSPDHDITVTQTGMGNSSSVVINNGPTGFFGESYANRLHSANSRKRMP